MCLQNLDHSPFFLLALRTRASSACSAASTLRRNAVLFAFLRAQIPTRRRGRRPTPATWECLRVNARTKEHMDGSSHGRRSPSHSHSYRRDQGTSRPQGTPRSAGEGLGGCRRRRGQHQESARGLYCLSWEPGLPNALIGIGAPDHYTGDPCHTTRHAGPHRAVREVEVACPARWTPTGRNSRSRARVLMPRRRRFLARFPVGASLLFASGSSSRLVI